MKVIDKDIKFYPKSGHSVVIGENTKYTDWFDEKGTAKEWKYDPFTGNKRAELYYPTLRSAFLETMTYKEYLRYQLVQANNIIKENTDYINNLLRELDKQ